MKERARERSAACATCGKTFARSDTLLRHEKNHHATEDRGPVHRVTNGTFRACSNCAQARSRCSGGEPCGRCKMRGIACNYPSKRRKGDDGNVSTTRFDGPVFDASQPIQLDNNAHNNHQPQPQLQNGQQTEFTVQTFDFKPEHPFGAIPPTQERMRTMSLNGQGGMIQNHHNQGPTVHFAPGLPNDTAVIDHAQQQQHQNMNNAFMSNQPEIPQQHEHYSDQTLAGQFPSDFGVSGDYNYDANYEDPLNWIPLSVYPSPYGDVGQDISFLLPTLSDTASIPNEFAVPSFNEPNATFIEGANAPHNRMQSHQMPGVAISQSPASSTSESYGTHKTPGGDSNQSENRKKRRRASMAVDIFSRPRSIKGQFAFPEVTELGIAYIARRYATEQEYSMINTAFQTLCQGSALTSFTTLYFPSLSTFNACIELYFDHFHNGFPVLHKPTFGHGTHWIVLLAAATIGSTFAKVVEVCDLRDAFQELLRRACRQVEEIEGDNISNLPLAQARILNLIGLAQSEREEFRTKAPKYHAELSRWGLEAGLLQVVSDQNISSMNFGDGSGMAVENNWHTWITEETRRRVGYYVWLLDTSFGYLINARPLHNMDDARAPMPCKKALWELTSAYEWERWMQTTPTVPSLCDALEELYNKKRIDTQLSEISHILLVHALISRTWEVGTHIKQPLSEWKPTGNAKGFLNTPVKDNFWLPLYPLYANWRNSACDCLDKIQWHASSVIAQAAGEEHDTVLHLHLSRVVLLTPFQELQDLIFFILDYKVWPNAGASYYVHDGSYQTRSVTKSGQIKKITYRWLREDQHKARLALIHAGSVFWHIRRYAHNTFFEPTAIYLATIVLWVYGSFKSVALAHDAEATVKDSGLRKPNQGPGESTANVQPTRIERKSRVRDGAEGEKTDGTAPRSSISHSPGDPLVKAEDDAGPLQTSEESDEDHSESSAELPEFIHLDRPNDDEMVQHFVRGGQHFSNVSISNVGDICKNPTKVLIEGAKLLKTRLSSWGISREYHDILMRLSEMRKTSGGAVVPVTPGFRGGVATPGPVR